MPWCFLKHQRSALCTVVICADIPYYFVWCFPFLLSVEVLLLCQLPVGNQLSLAGVKININYLTLNAIFYF